MTRLVACIRTHLRVPHMWNVNKSLKIYSAGFHLKFIYNYDCHRKNAKKWKRFTCVAKYIFYITPCVKCGFTHDWRAKIRILTPHDIKFRTILVRKTFSWWVWLHHSPAARAANSHSSEKVLSHSDRNVLFYVHYLLKPVEFWGQNLFKMLNIL